MAMYAGMGVASVDRIDDAAIIVQRLAPDLA
jgi:hypothetical protein